jgi:hypothetical protein
VIVPAAWATAQTADRGRRKASDKDLMVDLPGLKNGL